VRLSSLLDLLAERESTDDAELVLEMVRDEFDLEGGSFLLERGGESLTRGGDRDLSDWDTEGDLEGLDSVE